MANSLILTSRPARRSGSDRSTLNVRNDLKLKAGIAEVRDLPITLPAQNEEAASVGGLAYIQS
jgi:hypothetical protein